MQNASLKYRESMKQICRNRSYMTVTLAVVNQEAQRTGAVSAACPMAYYSNLEAPFTKEEINSTYATLERDFTVLDGTMHFLPRRQQDIVLNAGIVSEGVLGSIEIRFPYGLSIKGLTIDFSHCYPVDFTIISDNTTVAVNGHSSPQFTTEEVFLDATYLRFVPRKMVNGEGRLRIHQITMGVGIFFDNKDILSSSKHDFVSPITEEAATVDFSLTVDNHDLTFDLEEIKSFINFLEQGQKVYVAYGYDLDEVNGREWINGGIYYLQSWSANDREANFTATDRLYTLEDTYYGGDYSHQGISLYELARKVLMDAGVDEEEFFIDSYLQDVLVHNPIPVVTHKEALQMIANAGRCVMYQDREGRIFIKSSFIPKLSASSKNQEAYSQVENILTDDEKAYYGSLTMDFTDAGSSKLFLPRSTDFGHTGYVSQSIANADGSFDNPPVLVIDLEASFTFFGMQIDFGGNPPGEFLISTYLNGNLVAVRTVTDISKSTILSGELKEFDRMEITFVKGYPHNRILVDYLKLGGVTDYILSRSLDLMETPTGYQLERYRQLNLIRTFYHLEPELSNIAKETIEMDKTGVFTLYFNNPAAELAVNVGTIIEKSAYFATVQLAGIAAGTKVDLVITGRKYSQGSSCYSYPLNTTGIVEEWENPLISELSHGALVAAWIGSYLKADKEYEAVYRGDPILDANDLVYIEPKRDVEVLGRLYDHTIHFNGALSGSVRVRRYTDVDET